MSPPDTGYPQATAESSECVTGRAGSHSPLVPEPLPCLAVSLLRIQRGHAGESSHTHSSLKGYNSQCGKACPRWVLIHFLRCLGGWASILIGPTRPTLPICTDQALQSLLSYPHWHQPNRMTLVEFLFKFLKCNCIFSVNGVPLLLDF